MSDNSSMDDFVAASYEHSDDDKLNNEEDDLHLANVSEDQVYPNLPLRRLEAACARLQLMCLRLCLFFAFLNLTTLLCPPLLPQAMAVPALYRKSVGCIWIICRLLWDMSFLKLTTIYSKLLWPLLRRNKHPDMASVMLLTLSYKVLYRLVRAEILSACLFNFCLVFYQLMPASSWLSNSIGDLAASIFPRVHCIMLYTHRTSNGTS